MRIINHGKVKKAPEAEEFKCGFCGCEFQTDDDLEYYVDRGSCIGSITSDSYTYTPVVEDVYAASCPECHKIVIKRKERRVDWYTSTTSTSATLNVGEDGEK